MQPSKHISTLNNKFTKLISQHTKDIDSLNLNQVWIWIIIASGISLFLELMIIRIHSSYFQLFAYLKNVSMLSCFLGLGIGYARGKTERLLTPLVLPFLSLQIIAMYLLRFSKFSELLQNPISEQLSLGLANTATIQKQLFVFGFVIAVFIFNALSFIPLGQLTSRLMHRLEELTSYSWNLIGSLLGIIIFSALSLIWSPPLVWFIVGSITLLLFLYRQTTGLLAALISIIVVSIFLSLSPQPNRYDIFSPYQILTLTYSNNAPPLLMTSNSYYQKILDLRPEKIEENNSLKLSNEYYSLPYYFKQNPDKVLVVGSGTGNDVSAALRNNAKHIDAVEIDPAIISAGKKLHPEMPYQNPKVTAIVNDARAYIRYTQNNYDLIVYGLLDSHTLLSGRGGIRLDSYVYTLEAFKEARQKLNQGGVLSLTFALMSQELGQKLYLMLQQAFDGIPPKVYYSQYDGGYTFIAGKVSGNLPTHPEFKDVSELYAKGDIYADISTDDWPFFYMPVRKYPASSIFLITILFFVSLFVISKTVSRNVSKFSYVCFFLGAGFMLLETKGITELALNYGTTWYVNSIIIIFILLMGFLANYYVMKNGIPNLVLIYSLLFSAILFSLYLTTIGSITNLPLVNKIVMPIGLTLPLFFSGMAFSSALKTTENVGSALYSNLLGAMLGGFLEYNSMYFGFKSLYVFALIMYILAYFSHQFGSALSKIKQKVSLSW